MLWPEMWYQDSENTFRHKALGNIFCKFAPQIWVEVVNGTLSSSVVDTRTCCKNKPFLESEPAPGRTPQLALFPPLPITMVQKTDYLEAQPGILTLLSNFLPPWLVPCLMAELQRQDKGQMLCPLHLLQFSASFLNRTMVELDKASQISSTIGNL